MDDGIIKTQVYSRKVTVGTTDTILLPENPNRIAFHIGKPGVNKLTIAFNEPAVMDQGLNFPTAAARDEFFAAEYGTAVGCEIHAISDTNPQIVYVAEFLRQP